jgi:hypothetical protein
MNVFFFGGGGVLTQKIRCMFCARTENFVRTFCQVLAEHPHGSSQLWTVPPLNFTMLGVKQVANYQVESRSH